MKIKSKRTALALLAVMAVHPLANSQNLSDQEVARIISSGRYFPAARDFSLREKADTMEMRILYGFEYVIDTLSGKCLHEPYMLETTVTTPISETPCNPRSMPPRKAKE